jgi:hypothetical protein
MDLLPLDDPRWLELEHRNWSEGKRSTEAPKSWENFPDNLGRC